MPDIFNSNQPIKKIPEEKEIKKPAGDFGVDEQISKMKNSSNGSERQFLPKKSGNSLSSLLFLPRDNIRFETQEPEEKILMIVRAHWITNIPWVFLSIVIFIAPVVLGFFPLLDSFPFRYRIVFVIFWYLIFLMFVFEKFLSWFFNLSIITDERIVDVDFINLTTKKVSDCDLDKIQDVSFTNAGAIGTILNYGNVLVQTAAEVTEFVFEKVPRPGKIAEILRHLRTEEKIEAIEGRVR